WTGDDRKRPLSKKGLQQALDLVGLLKDSPVSAIFSSPYRRCVQTVEPLAKARRVPIKQTDSLAEGHGLNGLNEFLTDPTLDNAVLSTHGDIVWELVQELVRSEVPEASDGGYEKGSTWILEVDEE